MKGKKIAVATLLVMLTTGTPVYAETNASISARTGQITPYYAYLSRIGAGLSIEGNGYAICSGDIVLFKNYDSEITLTLQRSKNGVSWSNVTSWSKSFSGIGSHSLEKGYYVSPGYTYRILNTSKIKSGSTILETATCYSSIKNINRL